MISEASSIPNYTNRSNTNVFQLADDIERLPGTRLKTPFDTRINYYINQYVEIRTFYRYYVDDLGVDSSTFEVELPLKLIDNWIFTPSYRYFNQTAANYFKPYDEHSSIQNYYTSDYDLANFDANQYGVSIRYTDVFLKTKILNFGLKTAEIKYNSYERSTGLKSGILSMGFKFVKE